ncbi:hypothetical protein [Flavobacterium sp. ZE23DGlu08]|jgi:hypothetical protein|uniref:hypothetical protein n=1 Tax=Flavobacterium sp. ZE23DGlu08 TaxID=3059026 RepID=UPI00265FA8AB|nr:hypothetical protein [Flavobacterium sp. ZE23DGlu08]WKL44772.1 hypothetical protein Q1W72_03935 [Flavobacterium sp. ZE23DGlu08]
MYYVLVNIGYLILFFNLILFIKGFANQGKAYKIFTWYLGVVFTIQIISNIFMRMNTNNLFLSHFYFIGQFILLSFFYITVLKEEFQKKLVKAGLVIGLLALSIQYAYDTSLFFKFNLFEIFITSFLLIIYATIHFYNMLNEKKEFYYVNVGLLIYLLGSTILFLVGNLTAILSPKMSLFTWILNALLIIINQFFILIEWKKSFYKKEINTAL